MLNAYKDIVPSLNIGNNNNPIEKVVLAIDGEDAELVMQLLFDDENSDTDTENVKNKGTRSRKIQQLEVQFLRTQIMHLREENRQLKVDLERRDQKMERQLYLLNQNVQRIAYAPGAQRTTHDSALIAPSLDVLQGQNVEETGLDQQSRRTSLLGKHPRSLHDLWNEYEIGTPGKKAAKDFTARERGGKNKHTFYLRKILWDKVAEMVRGGMDAKTACDKMYEAYGHNQSVSSILKSLKADSKTGGHPNLHIQQI